METHHLDKAASQELFKVAGGMSIWPVIPVAWASRPRFFLHFEEFLGGEQDNSVNASHGFLRGCIGLCISATREPVHKA